MSATLNDLIGHLTICRDQQPWIGDLPVFLAKDAEGNNFRPTDGAFDICTDEDADITGLVEPGQKAVVIWPAW